MHGTLKAVAVAITLGAAIVANAAPAPAATAFVGVLQGVGTISPGITPAGTNTNSYTLTAADTTVGVISNSPNVAGVSGCGGAASTIAETIALGVGTGAWSCSSGPLAGRSGSLTFVRAGVAMVVVFTGGYIGARACVFEPDLPRAGARNSGLITSYHLTCAGPSASTT